MHVGALSAIGQRPAKATGWTAAVLVSAVWATLRLVVFKSFIFPLTYALPLLLCVWTRDKVMLWAMAAAYVVLHTLKQFWILPAAALPSWADWVSFGATLFNILVGAAITHAIIVLRDRLEAALEQVQAQSEELARQNEELAEQSEELARQNEELSQQSEELSQQSEETTEQSEELSRQNEELQVQSEEIQALSIELGHREALLQRLLEDVRRAGSEQSAIQHVCRAACEMLGPPVTAAIVCEVSGGRLAIRGSTGLDEVTLAGAVGDAMQFPWLVISENRPACLNDATLRPDLGVLAASGQRFKAVLGAPLQADGRAFGALLAYATEAHEWSTQQFRLAEWLGGQASQVLHTLRLRQLLERHATLVDLTPDAIIARHPEGTVTLWSRGAEVLYGWTAAEAVGQSTHTLLRTRFPEPVADIMQELARTGRWTGELVHTTKDGRERVVESRWLARRDEGGAVTELLESNVDITERKRTEQALREADRRKNQFLATLSHELRNPLAPIRFALKLIDSDGRAENARATQVIERQLAHLVRLVDDLLDLTRIASNKIRLHLARVDLRSVLEQAIEACRPEIQQAAHALTVSLPPGPVWVDADADRLAQVVVNLLSNSIRYTPAGGNVTVSCVADDGAVTISVRDDGIGLRREDLARVFEMFEQVGEPGHGGLGIGLSLVKELVELHRGTVHAHSAGPGLGAEFRVCLPLGAVPRPEAPGETVSPTAVPCATRRRILVVDDNVDAAEMMQTLLTLEGHEVSLAHDGESALARLGEGRFEVGLFDIGLPGMSGYELARRARQAAGNANLYLVAVTGWGQEDDRARARANGFDAHLTKPADPETLRALIAAYQPAAGARLTESAATDELSAS